MGHMYNNGYQKCIILVIYCRLRTLTVRIDRTCRLSQGFAELVQWVNNTILPLYTNDVVDCVFNFCERKAYTGTDNFSCSFFSSTETDPVPLELGWNPDLAHTLDNLRALI
jgi:hypothetical protein